MMNSRILISLALGLAILFVAGAMPVAATDGDDMGVCVIGADSPCNGDNASSNSTPTDPDEPVQYAPGELPYASGPADEPVAPVKEPRSGGTVGICVVGVDSPCNGEAYDGTDNRTVSDGLPLANTSENCVPGPATMCAPRESSVQDNQIQCVRAPCELPESAVDERPSPNAVSAEVGTPRSHSPVGALRAILADAFRFLGF